MIDKIKKELCTGCNGCHNLCPENCIDMVVDNTGFRYPKVNYDNCTKCRACIEVCPSLNKPLLDDKWTNPTVFAAWSLDEETRRNSTSGGVFSELAKEVLVNNGFVGGAEYNKKHLVEHVVIEKLDALENLRQSKYVQSDIGNVFLNIENKLKKDKTVAFCGTPCQVAGLINYLKKPYNNLITFDFVCRGINSPKAYLKYLEMLEKKYQSKVSKVWFKNKTYGWNRFSTHISFQNNKTYIKDRHTDLYMRGYIEENLYMRPCCFECKYKSFPRVADITLADFWGVSNTDTTLDPDKGTSLVMINSKKGADLFKKIENNLFFKEMLLENALPGNMAIIKSAIRNPQSNEFLINLDKFSFDGCFKKYAQNKGLKRFKRRLYLFFARARQIISKW